MSDASGFRLAGGCQCGTVRYAVHSEPTDINICHCRMCQKAFGSFFSPTFTIPFADLEITRGKISMFKSSDEVERGFCNRCGTPLCIHYIPGTSIHMSIGSLDEPRRVKPTMQNGVESRLPWFAELHTLTEHTTADLMKGYEGIANTIKTSNHQHPDHDTDAWQQAV